MERIGVGMQKNTIDNKKHIGSHKVQSTPERIWVTGKWSIEIPIGYTYSMDQSVTQLIKTGEGHHLLQVQPSYEWDPEEPYSADFNLVIFDRPINTGCFFSNLKSSKAKKIIREIEDKWLCGNAKRLIETKELVVAYGFEVHNSYGTACRLAIFDLADNFCYTGQITMKEGTEEERESLIEEFLGSIKRLPKKFITDEYKWQSEYRHKISFKENKSVEIENGLIVPIPDGFFAATGSEAYEMKQRLIIMPKGYDINSDYYTVPIRLNVYNVEEEVEFEIDELYELFCGVAKRYESKFSYGYGATPVKVDKKLAIVTQQFFDENSDADFFNVMLCVDCKTINIITIRVDYGGQEKSMALDFDLRHIAETWLNKFTTKTLAKKK